MQYQTNLYHIIQIKNFFKNKKLFYFVFCNSKKQKTNIRLNQQLLKQNFKIIKFKNIYLKNLLNYSIFYNLTSLCSSFIYFGLTLNQKFLVKTFTNIKVISLFVNNTIYNQKQLINLSSLVYKVNLKGFFFFLIRLFNSIRLKD